MGILCATSGLLAALLRQARESLHDEGHPVSDPQKNMPIMGQLSLQEEFALLYRFKSKDMGDVIMLEPTGRQILEIIGKDPAAQGIILPEQMPAAIAALEAAIALEESGDHTHGDDAESEGVESSTGVGLHQRALPFIALLKANHKSGHQVVWGV